MPKDCLIVLTLNKHRDGIWITKLVECLEASAPPSCRNVDVEVKILEDWLSEGWLLSDFTDEDDGKMNRIIGLVNRVSDAAPPALFKACSALLSVAEENLKIPVWNGSNAYSLCGNKWRHHLLFRQAKLSAPITMSYYCGKERIIEISTNCFRQNTLTGEKEVLIKPNAGGFGIGIQKISIATSVGSKAKIEIPSNFEDDMVLIQQYERPRDGKLYRVWFLNGKVQCGMERDIQMEGKNVENANATDDSIQTEFTSGCAGQNLCRLPVSGGLKRLTTDGHPSMKTPFSSSKSQTGQSPVDAPSINQWKVPEDVRQEIEKQLLPLIPDAHCGSVEFLYDSSLDTTARKNAVSRTDISGSEKKNQGSSTMHAINNPRSKRLYFDLNLLSTLPVKSELDEIRSFPNQVAETVPEGRRSNDDMPWLDLANSIWKFVNKEKFQI